MLTKEVHFAKLMPKVSYRTLITILSVSSMIFANVGLTQILKFSVPALTAIYPMAIVLMVLTLLNNFFKGNSYVYLFTMICRLQEVKSPTDVVKQARENITPSKTDPFCPNK